MAIQNLSFADLLASANRAASSPVLNMGPFPPSQQPAVVSPRTPMAVETITLPTTPVNQMPFEDLMQATVELPQNVPTVAPEAPAAPASREERTANLTDELKRMYGIVVETSPTARYGGRQSDLDKIHTETAKKLAQKGVDNLAQLTETTDDRGRRFVVNRDTGESLFEIKKDRDTGADKWSDILGGVKDGANLSIYFDSTGRAVLFPVHEKTKSIGQQLLGRDLAAFIEPVATIVGAYYGGPAGAAIGSSLGQLATTGKIEPEKVAMAAATTYISSEIASADYATKIGNSVLPEQLANTAAAKITGNAIVNSGVSGLIAGVTGGNVEQSMITGFVVGGAIASAPDIANTLMGGEANVQAIADMTGLELRQAQDIIASSIADGIVADAQNRDGFGSALGASLVARGLGTAAANKAKDFVEANITQNPRALATVFNGVKGVAQVATDAAVRGQDVGDALKAAGPGIVIQAGLSGLGQEPEPDRRAETDRLQVAGADEIGFSDTLELFDRLKAEALPSENVVDTQTADVDGVTETRKLVEGVRFDGMPYEYFIVTDNLGNIFYEYQPEPFTSVVSRERPDMRGQSGSFGIPQAFLSEYNALIDLREFGGQEGTKRAVIGGGGYGTGSSAEFIFIGRDGNNNEVYKVNGEPFAVIVLPNKAQTKLLASKITNKVYTVDLQMPPVTSPDVTPELKLTPKPIEQVKADLVKPQPVRLEPGPRAEGAEGASGAEGAAGTPGGATPGDIQEALRAELGRLEKNLQDAQKEYEQTQVNLARAREQQERLRAPNLVAAIGPDLQSALEQELAGLERAERESREQIESLGTQVGAIGALQQEEGQEGGRPSSEVIGDLIRGGFGEGLPSREGAGTGGVGGGEGPGAGEEGAGPGAGTEGFGPGAGEQGTGPGGGGEGGAGGGEEGTPLRPVAIFDSPDTRPVAPFASRVTGEALAGILGAKEPLFGGDPDEQRAVWNRRSLRLRRALGL
jgi:hypothetical protein